MVSSTKAPNTPRGDLARQSLLLRPVLMALLAALAWWVLEEHFFIGLTLVAYAVSSLVVAVGYRARLLGSSDVVYFGMIDTNLFLGAGTYFTGGGLSPVLFLFFGLQATYFLLARPRTFILAAAISAAAMAAAVLVPAGLLAFPTADPAQHPGAYLVAAVGSLAMLSSVGWLHGALYTARSQAQRHLTWALAAWRRSVEATPEDNRLTTILDGLMAALDFTDEGAVYRYDSLSGTLLLEAGTGLRPWFQRFPVFWPEEGIVGQAYRFKKRVTYGDAAKLRQCYGNLSQRNLEILEQVAQRSDPPEYSVAVPVLWEDEVLGVLLLSRQHGGLDEAEVELVEGFAAHVAAAMREAQLDRELAELGQEMDLQNRFHDLMRTVDGSPDSAPEFAHRLQRLVPFDAVRVAVAVEDEIEPDLGYFWCAPDLPLDLPAVDAQVRKELKVSLPGLPFLVNVDETLSGDNGPSHTWWVAPGLAEQGVSSVAGVIAQAAADEGPALRGILLLFHRDPTGYSAQHLEFLERLHPVLARLTGSLAASGRWQRQTSRALSVQGILGQTLKGGNEINIVKDLVQGVAQQLGGERPAPVAAILFNAQKGSVTITQADADAPDGFRHPPVGDHQDKLKALFQEWDRPEVRDFTSDDTIAGALRKLLGAPRQTQFCSFPLHHAGNALGIIVVPQHQDQPLTRGQRDGVRQLVEVAALCLQMARQGEAQSRQTRELQHEDELRRSLLSYITHEFRTPLASLKTSFELIQESEKVRHLEDPYQRLLVNVNRSVATLEQLTNDLSEVANISAGGVILNRSLISPESIVYPVLETTAPLSHLKNQRLEIEVPPELPFLMADARRLEQVLTNMVSNAIKYTPAGGAIKTTVCRENGSVKFQVSDTGPGIPEDDREKVFQPFYRVPQQAKLRAPGSGLGLALAKSLVELHGGKIWVESGPQKGSTFCFTIPIESRNP